MTTNLVEMTGAYQPEKTNENKRLRSGRRVKQDDKRRIAMRRKSNKKTGTTQKNLETNKNKKR
jgi:hypothetical protein